MIRVARLSVAVLAVLMFVNCRPSRTGVVTNGAEIARLWKSWEQSRKRKKKLKKKRKVPEPGVVFLLRDTTLRIDRKGRATRTYRKVFKILTPGAARYWAMARMEWAPWYQKKPEITATVTAPDGKKHRLDPRTIAEVPTHSGRYNMLTNRLRLRAPLPAVAEGSLVDLTIVLKEKRPIIKPGGLHWVYLTPTRPTMKSRLTIVVPASLPTRIKVLGIKLKPVRDTSSNGVRKVVYEAGPFDLPYPWEPMTPPEVPRYPRVVVSTVKDWAAVASAYEAIVRKQLRRSDVTGLVRGLVGSGKKTVMEVLPRFLAYIHDNVRYTSVAFDNAAIVPRPPAVTLRRTFGDCKDLSLLLIAMLRVVGIKAYPALLRTGPDEDVWPDMPGIGAFDHEIVYVHAAKPVWVDPTSRWTRAGDLPLSDRGRYALVIRPGSRSLVKTPPARPSDNRLLETRTVKMAPIKGALIREVTSATGSIEMKMRRAAGRQRPAQYRKDISAYIKRLYQADKMIGLKYTPPKILSRPFRIRLEATNSGHGWTSDEGATVKINLSALFGNLPNYLRYPPPKTHKAMKRKKDLWLHEPYISRLVYRILPPVAHRLKKVPPSGSFEFGPARLRWVFKRNSKDQSVTASFWFTTTKQRYSADEVRKFWEARRKFKEEYSSIQVLYEHIGHAHMNAGRFKRALDVYRDLIKRYPKTPVHRRQLAQAYITMGFGQKAREVARRAVRVLPRSPDTWWSLGWILQHDRFGNQGRCAEPQGGGPSRRTGHFAGAQQTRATLCGEEGA
jgi:transglutaminase-like putative cysteine protease/tetratricopeptide (TPR) repeat protein